MPRKLMNIPNKDGQVVRVSIGAKVKDREVDPAGILAYSSTGPSKEDQKAFSDWKQKVQSGEINISYP